MIDWPAKLFRRTAAKAAVDPCHPHACHRSGDADLLEAADRALRTVIEPELGLDIVGLGLVFRLTAREAMVEAEIGLVSPSSRFADQVIGQACAAIRRAVGGKIAVKVTLAGARRSLSSQKDCPRDFR